MQTPAPGLFGDLAVRKGWISYAQVEEALDALREEGSGTSDRMGEIFVAKGWLTPGQVVELLAAQAKQILSCPKCKRRYNVSGYNPERKYLCRQCKKTLMKPASPQGTQVDETIPPDLDEPPEQNVQKTKPPSTAVSSPDDAETRIGGNRQDFASTRWSLVQKARAPDPRVRRESLDRIITRYWRPVYFYARRSGRNVEDAKDCTQGFFQHLVEKDLLAKMPADQRSFRAFLLTCVRNFLSDRGDHDRAIKRGGKTPALSLDYALAEKFLEKETAKDPAAAYQRRWASDVLEQALTAVEAEYTAEGRPVYFRVLKERFHPISGHGYPGYPEIARRLALTESQVLNYLHHAKQRLKRALEAEVLEYEDSPGSAGSEIRQLFIAFEAP